ncbi:hypothetical protein GBA65_07865 [Rubrobacter marinus]|uniref:Lycopene cyclase n=1 Tax=Rubrobacter marinus TaxID=2653852 RepID=A0A6G8PW71_9ACTN|nr:lycopene cyclase family protein [Rubrobacter marinus]QIN78454.1 hypothetical protein GBA65_07865 [Rubrobacter marinus]
MIAARDYDVVFVGGGLSALLLLKALRGTLPGRVAVVDPSPPLEQPPVHWSYWSLGATPFDHFAVGAWRRARVADAPPEPIAPHTMRLVRSTDVFADLCAALEGVEWLRTTARSISRRGNLYEVATDDGALRTSRVFDSAPEVAPEFPTPGRPRALLSGTGLRVTADRPVFDSETATLFDPLDERSFAYVLPLGPAEALVESASFGPTGQGADRAPLLRYLETRHPGARFAVDHEEYGEIPLGFAPARTAGPGHVLLGAKRGLVKPSAGYGIVRIAEETEHLARLWRRRRPLPTTWRTGPHWRLLDEGFLRLATADPGRPLALLREVMRAIPLSQSLSFIDEELSLRQLPPLMRSAYPVVFGKL